MRPPQISAALFAIDFSLLLLHAPGITDDCRQRKLLRQLLQFLEVSIDEGGPFQQILRRIAAQAKLGENTARFGPALLALLRQAPGCEQNFLRNRLPWD